MKKTLISLSILSCIGAFGLAACGGGSSSGASLTGTKTTTGIITGFGSVFVNGVEYQTTHASISANGAPASENDLAVGMVVTLQGSVNSNGTSGTATTVSFTDDLEGVVLQNSIAAGATQGTLNIMGQTVQVTATTVLKSDLAGVISFDQIAPNQVVEVSGYNNGSGMIVATRLEVKKTFTSGDALEVKGVVSNLTATTFTLGGLTVDYSQATSVPSNLANGLYVEVKSTTAPAGATLVATAVDVEGDGQFGTQGTEGEEIEIQGVLSAVDTTNNTVTVNGQTISVSSESAATLAQLVTGTIVKVEAKVENGKLVGEVSSEQEGNTEIQAPVDSVSADTKTLTLMGQPVKITTSTMMQDESSAAVRYFSLANIAAGDYIEVNVYKDDTGALVATELKRVNPPAVAAVQLQGSVSAVNGTTITVSGFSVDISTATVTGTVTVGAQVDIHGAFNANVLSATSVQVQ